MIEISRKMTSAANRLIEESSCSASAKKKAHVSFADREAGLAVFSPADLEQTEENLLLVSLEEGRICGGRGMLPPDSGIHLALYRNYPQIRSIAYVCSPEIWALSADGKDLPVASSSHAMFFRDPIRCSKQAEGRAETVLAALEGTDVRSSGALLLHRDGALLWDETPIKALDRAVKLEKVAADYRENARSGRVPETISPDRAASLYQEYQAETAYDQTCGPVGSEVTDRQKKSIDIGLLAYFDKICRENGVKYSLAGGTLIGAVRHGGIIPWDDDVDVFMLRPEYDKLQALFPEGGRYQFVTREKDPDFNYVFGRLIDTWTLVKESKNTAGAGRGLCLDVCVVDGLPNNKLRRELHIRYMRFLVRMRRATIQDPRLAHYKSKGPLHVLAKRILRAVTDLHYWNRCMARAMKKYPVEGAEYVGNFTSQYGRRELLHASVFDSYCDVKFENLTCMVCAGYEEYLNSIYGDYLLFPPVEKRIAPHEGTAVWVKDRESEESGTINENRETEGEKKG